MPLSAEFFSAVRPLFGGKLTSGQVDGLTRIVESDINYNRLHCAYKLATVKHETADWMQPIREGARRYGLDYSDASAKKAVTAIFNKGIIRRNYSLPDGPFKQSYYGRGLVQITWYDNYKKFGELLGVPLAENPDLALDWAVSAAIMHRGMEEGLFRGKSLSLIKSPADYVAARDIINGDVKQYGKIVSDYAVTFYHALEGYNSNGSGPDRRRLAPAWWPF